MVVELLQLQGCTHVVFGQYDSVNDSVCPFFLFLVFSNDNHTYRYELLKCESASHVGPDAHRFGFETAPHLNSI